MTDAAEEMIDIFAPTKLARADARRMAEHLDANSIRWLVDLYYQLQEFRKASGNQKRAAEAQDEPAAAIIWTFDQMRRTEAAIKTIMDEWTSTTRPGRWLKGVKGIGPVLAAGLLATFDPTKPTVGHWWRFAGMDPTVTWEKGQKRPWSARAKVLCWKVGDSFVKVSGRDDAFYGQLYRHRKAYELARDADGGHKEAADVTLAAKRLKDKATIERYESGHLPDGRLDLRARRWAVKMLLSHLHYVMWEDRTGEQPPKPYAISILGHVDMIVPPGWPCE